MERGKSNKCQLIRFPDVNFLVPSQNIKSFLGFRPRVETITILGSTILHRVQNTFLGSILILILTPFDPYIPSLSLSLHYSLYSILIHTRYIPSLSLHHSLYSILILTPFLIFHPYPYTTPYIPSLSLITPFLIFILDDKIRFLDTTQSIEYVSAGSILEYRVRFLR